MQLSTRKAPGRHAPTRSPGRWPWTNALALWAVAALAAVPASARAQSSADVTGTVFYESGGPLNMLVINPGVDVNGNLGPVDVSVGYEADIVSGASVAVVDAPAPEVDAISTATQLNDVRHTAKGALTLESDFATLTGGYSFGRENDYRSHSMFLAARAEMFERDTAFDISYARGWDSVCNMPISDNPEAVDRPRMPNSQGCFDDSDPTRVELPLNLQTFQGGWTQAWTPIFTTQATFTAQVLEGYQGNPYRAVWLGRSAAQEHHPDNRTRYAIGIDSRLYLEPLAGTLSATVRGYRDTWDILSITAELGYYQQIGENLSLKVRGRYYNQTSAIFFSDNYALMPRGEYFTGDRELSAMSSWVIGGTLKLDIPASDGGAVLGFMETFALVGKADVMLMDFPDFHYGRVAVPNTTAITGTLSLESTF